MTKESKLMNRSRRNQSIVPSNGTSCYVDNKYPGHRDFVNYFGIINN